MQQQRQRIVRRMLAGGFGMDAGGGGIAVADREQPLRDRIPAAGLTPFAPAAPHPLRRAPHAAQDRPHHHRRDDDDAQHQHEDRQRGPGRDSRPMTARHRRSARQSRPRRPLPARSTTETGMIRIIEILIAPVWRAQPWRRSRIDGMRPARRRARRPCSSQPCAAARSSGSSVFNCRRASLKSFRSAAAVIRAHHGVRDRCRPCRCVRS